jgi:hypothetical protein
VAAWFEAHLAKPGTKTRTIIAAPLSAVAKVTDEDGIVITSLLLSRPFRHKFLAISIMHGEGIEPQTYWCKPVMLVM